MHPREQVLEILEKNKGRAVSGEEMALALQIIILAVYLVVAILAIMSRDAVQQVNDEVRENVREVKRLNVEVDSLLAQVSDPMLKKAVRRVSETVK